MDRFSDDHEALDFIASRIADEAQREGIPLSEVERKMLYFSETAWTLPDMLNVADEFDRDYDQRAYEQKISQLIKKSTTRAHKQQQEEFQSWREAIRRLSKEDRFILIMTEQAGLGPKYRPPQVPRPPGDLWKLWGTALLLVSAFMGIDWIMLRYHIDSSHYFSRSFLGFAFWALAICAALFYGFLQLVLGRRKAFELVVRVTGSILGRQRRER